MLLVTFCSAVLGLTAALLATGRLPERFPERNLVLATGPVAALLGGLVGRAVLGPGHLPSVLVVAALVSVAMLSLLVREGSRPAGLRAEPVARPRA